MIAAAALAAGSALAGGGLALGARRRPELLERTRTFAFAAAGGVVAFHLLPEVLPRQGLTALALVAAGFALPWLLETSTRRWGRPLLRSRGLSGLRLSAEVGLAALFFHSLVEGLALVAALAAPGSHVDLEVALVAHHAPLTAAVVLPFLTLLGPGAVLRRSLAVAAAGVAGAAIGAAVPHLADHGALLSGALSVTAGALLHVVADEIAPQRLDSGGARAADLAAALAGLSVAGGSALLQLRSDPAGSPLLTALRSALCLALLAAPALVAGLALAALSRRRARLDAPLLAAGVLGAWPAAAILAGVVAGDDLAPPGARLPRLLSAVRERGPRFLAVLGLAAAIEAATPELRVISLAAPLLALALLAASRLEPAGGVLLAAVLVQRGLPLGLCAGLVAVGACLRSTTRVRTLLGAAAGVGAALSLWNAVPRVALALLPLDLPAGERLARWPIDAAALAVLCGLALATAWYTGLRAWFAPLRHRDRG